MVLTAKNIQKYYQSDRSGKQTQVLSKIQISLKQGERLMIIGPNGCGKSTLLKILAQIDYDYDGAVDCDSSQYIGFLQQNLGLFPWKNCSAHIKYSINLSKERTINSSTEILNILKKFRLEEFSKSYPHQLSGGERQRLALARLFAYRPNLIFLDEPFSAIDPISKEYIYGLIDHEWYNSKFSSIIVTHDLDEAVFLGDRVIVLSKKPGHVIADIDIEIDRPRKWGIRYTEQFQEYVDKLKSNFPKSEV